MRIDVANVQQNITVVWEKVARTLMFPFTIATNVGLNLTPKICMRQTEMTCAPIVFAKFLERKDNKMRAEELLVERYLEMEKKVENLKKVIEQNEESIEKKIDEIEDYETLFDILKSHLQFDKFGITIELKSYIEKDKDDLEILKDFFELVEEKAENE